MTDVPAELKELSATLASIEAVLDLDKLRKDAAELEAQASAPDLWDDPEQAQKITSRLSYAQGEIRRVEDLRRRLDDAQTLWELAEGEDDEDSRAEVEDELVALRKSIDELEVRTLLSGEYDAREALVTIRAEAGGVDAADWAEMLLRMYLRWAERHNYATDVLDTSYAEEAGIKSATFRVKAPYAYGTLCVEQGTHRLVRISPFDNQGRRQTSFAGVEVLPVVESVRSRRHPRRRHPRRCLPLVRPRRPGRQHDRLGGAHHPPADRDRGQLPERAQPDPEPAPAPWTSCRPSCSSGAGRRSRPRWTRSRTAARAGATRCAATSLHPYQMVKDLRTEHEVGNPQAVLDGDIDDFIEAGIRWRRSRLEPANRGIC